MVYFSLQSKTARRSAYERELSNIFQFVVSGHLNELTDFNMD